MKLFFHLLHAGLWGYPACASLFTNLTADDWQRIYNHASRQAVLGVVYDGLSTLPLVLRPERQLLLKWFMAVERIESANRIVNSALTGFDAEMRSLGVNYCLLKGPSMAALYRNPLRRQSGDIDIFLPSKSDARTAFLWAQSEGLSTTLSVKHVGFRWQSASFELHRYIDDLRSPFASHHAETHRRQCLIEYPDSTVSVDGVNIPVFAPEANLFYLMLHIFSHLLTRGIGLRQFCDCALFAVAHRGEINGPRLRRLLDNAGLSRFADVFATILVDSLDLPADLVPYPYTPDAEMASKVLADILSGGNFGAHHDYGRASRDKWLHKLHTARVMVSRCMRFSALGAKEVIWTPAWYVMRNVELLRG
jgi:hypothetical protein